MNATPTLEDQLRTHYHATAEELRLPPLEFTEVLEHGPAVMIAPRQVERPRRYALLAAAALVLAGVIAGGLLLRSRSTTPASSTAPPQASTTAPAVAPTTVVLGSSFTPVNALLPTADPAGFHVTTVGTDTSNGPRRYTVWSSCADCAAPTRAVALVRSGQQPGVTAKPSRPTEDLTINGRAARYFPPTAERPDVMLVSIDGLEPGFGFFGWGVDRQTLVGLAGGVISGTDVPTRDGLVVVFDGQAGGLTPGIPNIDASVQIGYVYRTGNSTLDFMYQHSTRADATLAFALWSQPFAKYTTIDGHPAITSSYGNRSTIVVKTDASSLVLLTTDRSTMSVSDLAAISLTMASPTDPRWTTLKAGVQKAKEATVGLEGCILETYIVNKGDTPAGVAQRFGFTVDELKAANVTTLSFEAFAVGSSIFIPSNPPGVCIASRPTGRPQDTTTTTTG
jgi:hypothetical protein